MDNPKIDLRTIARIHGIRPRIAWHLDPEIDGGGSLSIGRHSDSCSISKVPPKRAESGRPALDRVCTRSQVMTRPLVSARSIFNCSESEKTTIRPESGARNVCDSRRLKLDWGTRPPIAFTGQFIRLGAASHLPLRWFVSSKKFHSRLL